MAGLSVEGLTIKRLPEIIDDLNKKAVTLFQDKVPPGDTVDTSAGSILGRFIGLQSEPNAVLWEVVQEVYDAFNPAAAQGVALDNVVSYGGLVRKEASPSRIYAFIDGSYNTVIPEGSVVTSSFTGNRFSSEEVLTLDNNNVSNFSISVPTVTSSATYSVVINSGLRTITCSFTADGSATLGEILAGIKASIDANASSVVTTSIIDNLFVKVNVVNQFNPVSVTLTGALAFSKIRKSVICVASENGPIEQNAFTVDTIGTPVLGWDKVENITAADMGRNRETDTELRVRFKNSKYVRGGNIQDALYSDLLALVGVESVIILTNDTASTDSNGIPAHSFMALVEGGISADIVKAIWKNKPVGIRTYGSSSASVTDAQNTTQTVYFQRPTPLLYYVSIDITTNIDFPVDGVDQIKAALVKYNNESYKTGDDIIYSRLYTPINSVTGFQINSLHIGTSASPSGTANIATSFSQIPTLDAVRIDITIT
jgi:uncharacterized phage protein gp47/JayE